MGRNKCIKGEVIKMPEWVKGLSVKSDDVSSTLWPPRWKEKINYRTCPLTSNAALWHTNKYTHTKTH